MTEKKPVINLQAIPTQKTPSKKEKAKKERPPLFPKKEPKEDANTRTIRFAPRSARSIFSYLFFGLFLVMCLVVIMTFGRVDTLTRLAMSKQVNKEELVTNINNSLKDTEQLTYEGATFTDHLFTITTKDEGLKKWEEQITPYLANGLTANDLGFSTTTNDRKAQRVRFIKLETVSEKEAIYRLYYDVQFTEGDVQKDVQVILPVSYEKQELKLIDYPLFTNLARKESENTIVYQENRFIPKGEALSDSERTKVTEFVQRFFELYVTNDEKLGLIANVQGLDGATLVSVEPKTMIQKEDSTLYVQGNYQFYFEKDSPFRSQFTLEIKPTKENYYVLSMNGE